MELTLEEWTALQEALANPQPAPEWLRRAMSEEGRREMEELMRPKGFAPPRKEKSQ